MKKAGIITHYDVHNHGAQLQLYALTQKLKELGYETKALKYHKNYDFMGGEKASKKYNISFQSIPIYIKYLFSNGLDRTLYNIKKRKSLSNFRIRNDLIGKYYYESTDLDVVVIGSDEIFSIESGPNPWYYGIGVPCPNQISYAASFGPTTIEMINEHNMSSMIKAGLEGLKAVSVRDRNSADIIEKIIGKEPHIVCDPVLLYDFPNQLNRMELGPFRREHPEKYCIVYSYDYNMNDDVTKTNIRKYADKRGLKIYSVGYFHRWCDKNIILNPLEVLKWFAFAEMVFTDTFHGTVISLETNTQFLSYIRGNSNKLGYILEQYGVSDRIIDDFTNIEKKAEQTIDYKEVNKTIKKIRNDSTEFLKSAISSCEGTE